MIINKLKKFLKFVEGSIYIVIRGNWLYYLWVSFLMILIGIGVFAYSRQFQYGMITTHMRDTVSWAFYIGQFTFLVGVAAAAVMLVIPAYIYNWKPIKEVVLFGELLAVSAILMCLLFVMADIGHPERFWHMIPGIGHLNFPSSLLSWDCLVLNFYLFLNLAIVTYLIYKSFFKETPNKKIYLPLVFISIPAAISIHTVTAFLYNGLPGRPFWNSALLAPRFIASAFCSGPAILVILFQILRKTTDFDIKDEAIAKIAELMAYAAVVNLYFFGCEIFKEYYSNTHHLIHFQFIYKGIHGHNYIVPYGWMSFFFNVIACVILLFPKLRKNLLVLNVGCLLLYAGIYIEKGMALLIPGFTPGTLGQIYDYFPSLNEIMVSAGIFSAGFLAYTFMVKVAVAVTTGKFSHENLEK
ncbi:MAG: polysulfide reductase [Planctomycetota bacterium]|nr:MAG: polysulfide reductase [Planctomycetota bacterium]